MQPRTLLSLTQRTIALPAATRSTQRAFHTTPRFLIKEDANRTPSELEAAKQEQLKEQKEGKGRWREDLASQGESNIAADKESVQDHGEHMKELQDEGKKMGEQGKV
jgi:hypothetical protein